MTTLLNEPLNGRELDILRRIAKLVVAATEQGIL